MDKNLTVILIIGVAATFIISIISLIMASKNSAKNIRDAVEDELRDELNDTKQDMITVINTMNNSIINSVGTLQSSITQIQQSAAEAQHKQIEQLQTGMNAQLEQSRNTNTDQLRNMLDSLGALQKTNEEKLEGIRTTISGSMKDIREENSKKLDEIRGTVDEKLQTTLEKRISESFKAVSDQLEQVYKGIGEMQTLATDVGGLKKVLSGVKTRGILGEVQLGAILQEILAPEQYETNVITKPGSTDRVEFAVKLPGNDGNPVLLPIDSKFPGDRYAQLLMAQESGDKAAVDAAYKNLEAVIKSEAKDISEKYISVPETTDFGIMFLPFEGLYAEIVNRGLIEVLQHDYRVNVTGPSTMAAFLNSLQMGFRTLAIQKKSGEVWNVLGAVKAEFSSFDEVMQKMAKHLKQTNEDLETLSGTRTRAIMRKLKEVETLDMSAASEVLELPDALADVIDDFE